MHFCPGSLFSRQWLNLKLRMCTVCHYHGEEKWDVRVKLAVKREERGEDEWPWKYFWEFYLYLKVVFPFDIFSISWEVTLTQHEQSASGISSLWVCLLTTSVDCILNLSAMAVFLKKMFFTSTTWKCSTDTHKITLPTSLGLNDNVNECGVVVTAQGHLTRLSICQQLGLNPVF